mgnify:CR=1 FL=1
MIWADKWVRLQTKRLDELDRPEFRDVGPILVKHVVLSPCALAHFKNLANLLSQISYLTPKLGYVLILPFLYSNTYHKNVKIQVSK